MCIYIYIYIHIHIHIYMTSYAITHLQIYFLPIDMLILADADPAGPSLRMDAMSHLHGQQVVGNAGCQTSCFFYPFMMGKDESHINIHQHTYMVWSYESHGLWIQWRYTMMLWIPWLNPTGSNYWGFQAPRRLDPAPSHQFFCPKNGPWWCVAGAADSLKPSPLN